MKMRPDVRRVKGWGEVMMTPYPPSSSPWSRVLKKPDTIDQDSLASHIAGQWAGRSEGPFSGKSPRGLACDPSSSRRLPGLNGRG